MLVQGNYAPLLTPGLRDIFNTTAGRPDPMRDTLYQIVPSTMASESYLGFGSRRLVQPYRGSIPYEDQDAYYETSIRNVLLVDGMAVEKVLLEDDQYGTIRQMAADFSENFATTREHDAVQPFINAFTDAGVNRLGLSTAGADAVGLCSLLHPNGPINAGTTQANEGTLALSIDNYDTTRQAMLNWTDDKGGLMASKPDVILVPTELQRTAEQIFNAKAIYEPGSAERLVRRVEHNLVERYHQRALHLRQRVPERHRPHGCRQAHRGGHRRG